MKKVFLAVLAAGLFFACGNKDTKEEAKTTEDKNATEQKVEDKQIEQKAEENPTTPAEAEEQKNEMAENIEAAGDATKKVIEAVGEVSTESKAAKGRGK